MLVGKYRVFFCLLCSHATPHVFFVATSTVLARTVDPLHCMAGVDGLRRRGCAYVIRGPFIVESLSTRRLDVKAMPTARLGILAIRREVLRNWWYPMNGSMSCPGLTAVILDTPVDGDVPHSAYRRKFIIDSVKHNVRFGKFALNSSNSRRFVHRCIAPSIPWGCALLSQDTMSELFIFGATFNPFEVNPKPSGQKTTGGEKLDSPLPPPVHTALYTRVLVRPRAHAALSSSWQARIKAGSTAFA